MQQPHEDRRSVISGHILRTASADAVQAPQAPTRAVIMKLPIPMQQFLSRQANALGSTPLDEKNALFQKICAMARSVDSDPAYRGVLAEQLLLLGKRFLINRSEDSIRATVIGELNKVVPFSAAQPSLSTAVRHRDGATRRPAGPEPINDEGLPEQAQKPSRVTIKTAAALRTMTFAPLKYIVPELIVEGCVLLAGRPKVGKSWLALEVGLAVAAGRYCLGERKPERGRVLHLALEDGDRRMQRRITKVLPTFGGEWPEAFDYATQWPRADQGGIDEIEQWCDKHADARLVVIDVLAKLRAPSQSKRSVYEQDYAALSKLQELATRRSITILVVHHTRKGEADDPVEEISGTLGLSGAADAFLVLKKSSAGATLTGRCRDTEDVDLAVQFSRETCRWIILGDAAQVQRSDQRARVLAALENAPDGLSVLAIMAETQLRNRNAADLLLSKMAAAGEITRVKRGVYCLPQYAGQIGQKGQKDTQPSEITNKNVNLSFLSDLSRVGETDGNGRSGSHDADARATSNEGT